MKKKHVQALDLRRYSYWKAFYLSFFSPALSLDVFKRWKGLGALYLFFVVTLSSMPFLGRITADLHHYLVDDLLSIVHELPTIQIDQGQVLTDAALPLILHNQTGKTIGIITWIGRIDDAITQNPDLLLFITLNSIQFRFPPLHFYLMPSLSQTPQSFSTLPINTMNHVVFSGHTWAQQASTTWSLWLFLILLYLALLNLLYGILLSNLLMFGLMGQAIASIFFKFKLNYHQACRLLAISSTPPLLVLFLYLSIGVPYVSMSLCLMILFAVYFCLHLIIIRRGAHTLMRR